MNGPLAFLLLLFSQSLNSDAMMWHLRGHSVFRKQVVSDLQFSIFQWLVYVHLLLLVVTMIAHTVARLLTMLLSPDLLPA